MNLEPRVLSAPSTKGCVFCAQPAQFQLVGGDELDEIAVYYCHDHQLQARQRWQEIAQRFLASLDE